MPHLHKSRVRKAHAMVTRQDMIDKIEDHLDSRLQAIRNTKAGNWHQIGRHYIYKLPYVTLQLLCEDAEKWFTKMNQPVDCYGVRYTTMDRALLDIPDDEQDFLQHEMQGLTKYQAIRNTVDRIISDRYVDDLI